MRQVGLRPVLNAGVMGLPDVATIDGFDPQMRTTFLAHFLIVHELMAELSRAACGPANTELRWAASEAAIGEAFVVQ